MEPQETTKIALEDDKAPPLIGLTADIVSAFVSNNSLPAAELPTLIASVHNGLSNIGSKQLAPPDVAKEPAVPIKKSVTNDFIVCLEDGKKFKSLKRHLATAYNLTPSAYRAKWGLPSDYPMVAPDYSQVRSGLAKAAGLGVQRSAASASGKKKPNKKAA